MKNNNPSIAIVGNSPCILEHEWGEEIDSHDIVVRFNNFVTEGYEQYAGNKTTIISVTNSCVPFKNLNLYLNLSKNNRFFMTADEDITNDLNKVCENKLDKNDVTTLDINTYYIGIRDKMLNYKENHFASTGLMVMQYIVDTYKDSEIDVYGFSFFEESKIHLYDNATADWHDGNKENEYFNKFLKDKVNYHK